MQDSSVCFHGNREFNLGVDSRMAAFIMINS